MDKAEFDKRFLTLVNTTNVVITAPNIAYNLDIPIEEAQEHLLSLELNSIIQQKDDDSGNSIYVMPNRPAPGAVPGASQAESQISGGGGPAGPQGVHNPADLPRAPLYSGPASAPASGKAVNGLVLNVIFPGLGSLTNGQMVGIAMMALVLLGLIFIFALSGWSKLVAILPIAAAWIWSLFAGIKLLDRRESS